LQVKRSVPVGHHQFSVWHASARIAQAGAFKAVRERFRADEFRSFCETKERKKNKKKEILPLKGLRGNVFIVIIL